MVASGPRLEIDEVLPSSFMHNHPGEPPKGVDLPDGIGSTGSERQQIQNLRSSYGWLNALRVGMEEDEPRMCRWMLVL